MMIPPIRCESIPQTLEVSTELIDQVSYNPEGIFFNLALISGGKGEYRISLQFTPSCGYELCCFMLKEGSAVWESVSEVSRAKPASLFNWVNTAIPTILHRIKQGEEGGEHAPEDTPRSKDTINPDHYKIGGINVIDIAQAKSSPEAFRGFLFLSAVKYIFRAAHKGNELEDWKKAQWFVERMINELEAE